MYEQNILTEYWQRISFVQASRNRGRIRTKCGNSFSESGWKSFREVWRYTFIGTLLWVQGGTQTNSLWYIFIYFREYVLYFNYLMNPTWCVCLKYYRVRQKTLVHFLYHYAKSIDAIGLKISAMNVNIIWSVHENNLG